MKASLSEGNQDKPLSPNIRAVELKKLTMDACIAYRNGPELDSITKAIYKKYKIKDLYKD